MLKSVTEWECPNLARSASKGAGPSPLAHAIGEIFDLFRNTIRQVQVDSGQFRSVPVDFFEIFAGFRTPILPPTG